MKTITKLLIAIVLAWATEANADLARVKITVAADGKSWTGQLTQYTKNAVDEIYWTIVDSFGVTTTRYTNFGAHRGYTWANEAIGKEVYTNTGNGGGGGGTKHEDGPNGLQFSISIDSENGSTMIGGGTILLPFISGSIHFRGTIGNGFRFHSYTPSSAAPTHSNNGSWSTKLYWWSIDANKGAGTGK